MPVKRASVRDVFKGRTKSLRALGYTLDKRGRPRKNGKPVKVATIQGAAKRIDRKHIAEVDRTKLLTGLERTTTKKERAAFTVKDAAKWTGESQRTVQKWIDKGGTPPAALDCIRAKLSGKKCLPIEWKHGKKKQATQQERDDLRRKLRMFVQGKRKRATDEKKRHADWYAAKKKLRKKLSKGAWIKLMKQLNDSEGLAEEGDFSIWRLILS